MNWKFTFRDDQIHTLMKVLEYVSQEMYSGCASQTTHGLAQRISRKRIEELIEQIQAEVG